jgi:hypothetical protein
MPAPIFYGINRLETSTVTANSTVANHPVTRLYDRFIGPQWQGGAPIVWDQGSAGIPYDTVLGAPGHNLAGATLQVQTDDNAGFATPTVLGSVVATSDPFRIVCTGSVERYNRLTVSGGPPPGTIELTELWASVATTAPNPPLYDATSPNQIGNFIGNESETGVWMVYVRSAPRWEAQWHILGFTRTIRDLFFDFFGAISGGGRPCFVLDDESELRYVRWLNAETAFAGLKPTQYSADFHLREVGA